MRVRPSTLPPMRLALAAALVLACNPSAPVSATPEPPAGSGTPPATTVPATSEALEVTIAPAATQVAAGAPLALTVTVRNRGQATATIPLTSGCATDFEVLDGSDAVVAESGQMCTQVMGQRTLAPGESFVDRFSWAPGTPGMAAVPPGRYRLRGVLLRQGAPLRSAPVPLDVVAAR